MKKTLFLLATIITSYTNAQEYVWAKSMNGTEYIFSSCIAVDNSGNIYVTGNFYGTVDFDPSEDYSNLTSVGDDDIFIAKYNSTGTHLWSQRIGGSQEDIGLSLAVDNSGAVYVTGHFGGTVDFDSSNNDANLVSAGGTDIFIAKYDVSGNYIWANRMGDLSDDSGVSIVIDSNDFLLVAGKFYGSVDFDPSGNTAFAQTSAGIFIAKYDTSGNFIWVRSLGGENGYFASPRSIDVDMQGNAYLTGAFQGTMDFDSSNDIANLSTGWFNEIFVVKYSSSGNYVWAKSMGGENDDISNSIAVDNSGNVYITGTFLETADFDPSSNTNNLISEGDNDIFIAKYDTDGNLIWANGIGNYSNLNFSSSIVVDAVGSVFMTGSFYSFMDFDPSENTANLSTPIEGTDVFIAKYDTDGGYMWAKRMGGPNYDGGQSIAIDASGNLHVTGYFLGNVDFDPSANSEILSSTGGETDIFIGKYLDLTTSCIATFSTDIQTTCGPYTWINGNTYDDSNNSATYIIENAAGCDSIITLNLTINAINTEVLQSGNILIAQQQNATYQWIDCDNSNAPIQGATSQDYSPTVSGNYAVVISIEDCSATSECQSVTITSVNEASENLIRIYPNPSTGIVYVNGTTNELISVTDAFGKTLIANAKFDFEGNALDLSSCANGIYFIIMKKPNLQTAITKIITIEK